MPYRREGKKIYSKAGGKWHLKQVATSIANAKKALKLLYGIESGNWTPTNARSSDVQAGRLMRLKKR